MFDTMAMEIEQLLTKVRHWLPMGSKLSYIYYINVVQYFSVVGRQLWREKMKKAIAQQRNRYTYCEVLLTWDPI